MRDKTVLQAKTVLRYKTFVLPFLVPEKERIKKFVEELRAWTEQRYGRQQELADAIGVHKSVISNWFAERQFPTAEQLLAVQEFLAQKLGWKIHPKSKNQK